MTPTSTGDSRSGDSQEAAGITHKDTDAERPLLWPCDPAAVTAEAVDFEALAHVLANTCLWGGRSRRFHSLAGRAVIMSEEIEALDGLDGEDRRVLALHALLADARAAGLDPELPGEWAELLRFVRRMTTAAECRDLPDAAHTGTGTAFPPLRRRIRPVGPGRAARLWLRRFDTLKGPPLEPLRSAAGAGSPNSINDQEKTDDGYDNTDAGDKETAEGRETQPPAAGIQEKRRAA